MAKEKEESLLYSRSIRQLLVTYLTSVRGGTALRALMEQLVGKEGNVNGRSCRRKSSVSAF